MALIFGLPLRNDNQRRGVLDPVRQSGKPSMSLLQCPSLCLFVRQHNYSLQLHPTESLHVYPKTASGNPVVVILQRDSEGTGEI